MINIQIDEQQLKKMMSKTFKEHVGGMLKDTQLEYWVRDEVHKLLAKEVVETVKPMLTEEKLGKLLREAFNNYVEDRM